MRHLILFPEVPAWHGQANCSDTDPETFYPEVGINPQLAKRVCDRCKVKTECMEYALDRDERFGVWGGLSERERRALKQQRNASTVQGAAA